jgi:hypothetical protein
MISGIEQNARHAQHARLGHDSLRRSDASVRDDIVSYHEDDRVANREMNETDPASIVATATGHHVWGDSYDGDPSDLLRQTGVPVRDPQRAARELGARYFLIARLTGAGQRLRMIIRVRRRFTENATILDRDRRLQPRHALGELLE